MRRYSLLLPLTVTVLGCSGQTDGGAGGGQIGGSTPDGGHVLDSGAPLAACTACLSDTECGREVCGQFQGDLYCAVACPNGDECGAGTTCTPVTTASGAKTDLCVPNNSQCGTAPPPPGTPDAGTHRPDAGSTPHDAGGHDAALTDASGGGGATDSGLPTPKGTIGANGGTASSLYFAVVGDTRPGTIDDTAKYPTAIIDQIYADMASMSPPPLFSISTGDYQFSTATGTQATTQIGYYMSARAKYAGPFFPALGNHECTGATASNCGTGNTNGITNNYTAFMSLMLAPIQKTLPYYAINIDAADGSWTSKFVFVAGNAWDSTQATWLTGVLSKPTTYTFVIRHEPIAANTAPGVTPSEAIIKQYPLTMRIVGHTHTYGRPATQEVLYGNGGAPITGTGNYGFGLVQQRADKAIQFDMIDYQSLQPDTKFRFAVNPDGTAAP